MQPIDFIATEIRDSELIRGSLTEKEFSFILASIFIPNGYQGQTVFDLDLKQKWVLRTEAYFSYLQYLEFCHAVEHARRAYWVAILAVIIALIGVGISVS